MCVKSHSTFVSHSFVIHDLFVLIILYKWCSTECFIILCLSQSCAYYIYVDACLLFSSILYHGVHLLINSYNNHVVYIKSYLIFFLVIFCKQITFYKKISCSQTQIKKYNSLMLKALITNKQG